MTRSKIYVSGVVGFLWLTCATGTAVAQQVEGALNAAASMDQAARTSRCQ